MMEGMNNKWQWFRTIMEAVTVAAILWTASSISDLKTQVAVLQNQNIALAKQGDFYANTLPTIQQKQAEIVVETRQLRKDVDELKSVRNLK